MDFQNSWLDQISHVILLHYILGAREIGGRECIVEMSQLKIIPIFFLCLVSHIFIVGGIYGGHFFVYIWNDPLPPSIPECGGRHRERSCTVCSHLPFCLFVTPTTLKPSF